MKKEVLSVSEMAQKSAQMRVDLSKEDIEKAFEHDMKMVYALLADILRDPKIVAAITEVMWERYVAVRDAQLAQSEMDFDAAMEKELKEDGYIPV